jgi:CRISPR-associated protein Cas1
VESLLQLTRFDDRMSYLYLEKGRIEQEAGAVAYVTEKWRVPIPAADLALLLLGPGTSITHAAVCNLADCNCTVAWVGDEGLRFYCSGRGGTHFSANLLHQAAMATHAGSHREVVRRMYEMRFHESIDPNTHLQAVRGKEGYRVRAAYQAAAEKYAVEWHGRRYDANDWNSGDPVNRALSAASACLNGLVQAAVVSAGYSPAIGFIHTGKMLSFVYDIADLYKVELVVPVVFQTVAAGEKDVESRVRMACRELFQREKLMSRIVPDIRKVLNDSADPGKGASPTEGRSESLDDRTEGRNLPRPHDSPNP